MGKINLQVIGLIQGTADGSYSLLLEEQDGTRRLPVLIGSFEAQAIALAIEKKKLNRPLTHDLFEKVIELSGVKPLEVLIHNLLEGIFYAQLLFENEEGDHWIDCRPSDGIAIALRMDFPIKITSEIMDKVSISMDDLQVIEEVIKPGRPTEEINTPTSRTFEDLLKTFSKDELNKMLDDAEGNEDYEKAALIRDELNRR